MRRYGQQCQTLFGLFNSFFLSPPSFVSLRLQCVSLRLQPISLSLCLAFSSPSRHADLTTPRDRDRPSSPLITDPLYDEEELQCEGHGGRK